MSQSPDWAKSLFAKWDAEIFSQHNKSPGRTPDDEGETIKLDDDADEISRDMDALDIDYSDQELNVQIAVSSCFQTHSIQTYFSVIRTMAQAIQILWIV
jgi:hypothetical protein